MRFAAWLGDPQVSTPIVVSEDALPALHEIASNASMNAQHIYLMLVRLDLGALFVGALLTAVGFHSASVAQSLAALGAILLIGSLVLTLVISVRNYEQQWYGGRAAAESAKTLAWRYMAGAEPFSLELPEATADTLFVQQLSSILEQSEQLRVQLGGVSSSREQITAAMRQVRSLSVSDRKDVYVHHRVGQQQNWYSMRAGSNMQAERNSFIAMTLAQFVAVVAAVVLVVNPTFAVNISSVAAAAAAAIFAWLQVKRHQELAQSYAIAAQELSMIAEEARSVTTEERFVVFVADAESAISREHTLWVARRGVPGARKRLAR